MIRVRDSNKNAQFFIAIAILKCKIKAFNYDLGTRQPKYVQLFLAIVVFILKPKRSP